MPIGYLVTTALAALVTLFALAPPRPRQSSPTNRSYWLGFLVNELPFVLFYWLLASTLLAVSQGDLATPVGLVGFGLAVLTTVGLAVIVRRALRTGPVIERALSEGLGADWRSAIDPALAARLCRRLPFPPPVRAVPPRPSRCRAHRKHQLWHGRQVEPAGPLPPSLPSVGRRAAPEHLG